MFSSIKLNANLDGKKIHLVGLPALDFIFKNDYCGTVNLPTSYDVLEKDCGQIFLNSGIKTLILRFNFSSRVNAEQFNNYFSSSKNFYIPLSRMQLHNVQGKYYLENNLRSVLLFIRSENLSLERNVNPRFFSSGVCRDNVNLNYQEEDFNVGDSFNSNATSVDRYAASIPQ